MQTLSVLTGSCRGDAGTHLVLVEETPTLSVLTGSCRGGAGTHLVLVEEMQTLSVVPVSCRGGSLGSTRGGCRPFLFSLALVEEV